MRQHEWMEPLESAQICIIFFVKPIGKTQYAYGESNNFGTMVWKYLPCTQEHLKKRTVPETTLPALTGIQLGQQTLCNREV